MTKIIVECPDCGEIPNCQSEWMGYSVICECHDPTPYHSGDDDLPAPYSGNGWTKVEAIIDWNECISAAKGIK